MSYNTELSHHIRTLLEQRSRELAVRCRGSGRVWSSCLAHRISKVVPGSTWRCIRPYVALPSVLFSATSYSPKTSRMKVACVFAAVFIALAASAGSDVIELTSSNFKSSVLNSDDIWLVEFYGKFASYFFCANLILQAPWCGHCKSLAPEWAKAATALKGIVKLGAVDMTAHAEVGQPYGIQGFPTIKIFGQNKAKPTDYQGLLKCFIKFC